MVTWRFMLHGKWCPQRPNPGEERRDSYQWCNTREKTTGCEGQLYSTLGVTKSDAPIALGLPYFCDVLQCILQSGRCLPPERFVDILHITHVTLRNKTPLTGVSIAYWSL